MHNHSLDNRRCRRCNCRSGQCGCDSPLLTSPIDYSTNCPNPQVCDEFTLTGCVVYNGPDIPDYNIFTGDPLNLVLGKLLTAIVNPSCILQDGSPAPTCEAVALVSVVSVNSTSIKISWPLVTPGLGYIVSWGTIFSGPFTQSSTLSSSTDNYTITGLTPGTAYYIYVTTNCSSTTCDSLIIGISTTL